MEERRNRIRGLETAPFWQEKVIEMTLLEMLYI